MTKSDPMSWRADFIKWCEDEVARMREQLAPLESGEMHLGRRQFGAVQLEDITPDEIARLKRSIADLEDLISRVRSDLHKGVGAVMP